MKSRSGYSFNNFQHAHPVSVIVCKLRHRLLYTGLKLIGKNVIASSAITKMLSYQCSILSQQFFKHDSP
jgi:hypothetical protein